MSHRDEKIQATEVIMYGNRNTEKAAENSAAPRSSVNSPYTDRFIEKRHAAKKKQKQKEMIMRAVYSVGIALFVFAIAMIVIVTSSKSSPEMPPTGGTVANGGFVGLPGIGTTEDADPTEGTNPTEEVKPTYAVTLAVYGRENVVFTTESMTVGELLDREGVTFAGGEVLRTDRETFIEGDMTITVDLVEYETVTVWDEIPFETSYNSVQTIPKGQYQLVQAGANGAKSADYRIERVNGQEISRTLVDETVTQYPTNAIYNVGVGGTFTGKNGKTYSYSYYIDMTATYYTPESSPSDTTYSGEKVSERVIAVDPNVIPLWTDVYVENEVVDYGERTALDIGGGIKGNKIDIFLWEPDDYIWWYGVINVRVYILD